MRLGSGQRGVELEKVTWEPFEFLRDIGKIGRKKQLFQYTTKNSRNVIQQQEMNKNSLGSK